MCSLIKTWALIKIINIKFENKLYSKIQYKVQEQEADAMLLGDFSQGNLNYFPVLYPVYFPIFNHLCNCLCVYTPYHEEVFTLKIPFTPATPKLFHFVKIGQQIKRFSGFQFTRKSFVVFLWNLGENRSKTLVKISWKSLGINYPWH